ncbi:sugar (and other) transporter family protein [Burkholderia cenocepacia]|uniref:Sugar (And other) transporter family protein n=1 Tax=Burkholderia cenocepacia TaxID=95486 RepID=A0AAN0RRH0_9BURK|nr:sugar (and other) transporter family protein [Burkholderia cenocepacia]
MSAVTDRLRARVMAPLFCVVAIDAIGMGVIVPLLPFYSQHFGASPFAIGALVAIFSLGQFVAAPMLGRLSDRSGRKAVLLGSQLGTFASLVLLACAGNLLMVFIARILDGITSGNLSVASAYAVDHSSPQNRRRAIGLISAAIGVGMMIGPSLSAGLSHISISAPIWGAALLSLLSAMANLIFLPDDGKTALAGTTSQRPSMRPELRSSGVVQVLVVLALFYFGFSMYVSQFALFLQEHYEWNGTPFGPREVGYIFTASGAINIIIQTTAMKWFERVIPENLLAAVSLLMFSAGLSLLNFVPGLTSLVVGLVFASVGTAMTRPTLMAALSMASSTQQQGALMGVSSSLMAICNVIAPLFAGAMIDHGLYFGWAVTIAAIMAVGGSCTLVFVRLKKWPVNHLHALPDGPFPPGSR